MANNERSELKYIEFRKDRHVDITFKKICPCSSGTIKEQTTKKNGISIVAFFSNNDKKQIRDIILPEIHDLHYGFVPTKNLHCTFLSLSSKETFHESNSYFNVLIKEQIKKFLCERNSLGITLLLDEIRPGTWYGKDQYPIPHASNGTVVAIGKPFKVGNYKFVKLANDLAESLKNSLYPLFGNKFDRNFPTVWSTLGYFDHMDFDITNEFEDTFDDFRKLDSKIPLEIKVSKISLVEYSYKDLREAQIIETFKL